MAKGKRRRHAKQGSMWAATQDLPRSAAHPFYTRLNQILDEHHFDGYVEGLCARFYTDRTSSPDCAEQPTERIESADAATPVARLSDPRAFDEVESSDGSIDVRSLNGGALIAQHSVKFIRAVLARLAGHSVSPTHIEFHPRAASLAAHNRGLEALSD